MSFNFDFNTTNGSSVPVISTGTTGPTYSLPAVIGAVNQVIISNGTSLSWGAGGGGASLLNAGVVNIGSTDDKLILQATKSINLDSGLIYKYTAVSSNYTLLPNDYFVNCATGCSVINLPNLATTDSGLSYIINKGYSGGNVTIVAFLGDTIDGDGSFVLSNLNEKIQIISDGSEKWLLM
jgi:hypothetical protein